MLSLTLKYFVSSITVTWHQCWIVLYKYTGQVTHIFVKFFVLNECFILSWNVMLLIDSQTVLICFTTRYLIQVSNAVFVLPTNKQRAASICPKCWPIFLVWVCFYVLSSFSLSLSVVAGCQKQLLSASRPAYAGVSQTAPRILPIRTFAAAK